MRILIALAAGLGSAACAGAADLALTVEGLRSRSGNLSICLFRQPSNFPDCEAAKTTQRLTLPATRAGEPIVFRGLGAGAYAVTVLHDENGDGRLDTNLLGIPKEGVGITNNRLPKFSAPTFTDARFEMPEGRQQTVTVEYW